MHYLWRLKNWSNFLINIDFLQTVGYTYMAALNLKICEENMNQDVLIKN